MTPVVWRCFIAQSLRVSLGLRKCSGAPFFHHVGPDHADVIWAPLADSLFELLAYLDSGERETDQATASFGFYFDYLCLWLGWIPLIARNSSGALSSGRGTCWPVLKRQLLTDFWRCFEVDSTSARRAFGVSQNRVILGLEDSPCYSSKVISCSLYIGSMSCSGCWPALPITASVGAWRFACAAITILSRLFAAAIDPIYSILHLTRQATTWRQIRYESEWAIAPGSTQNHLLSMATIGVPSSW